MKKTSRIPDGLTLDGAQLDHYYHDFRYELAIPRPTDAAGIPLWDYGYPIGARYHPVLLGASALAAHEHYLCTHDPAAKEKFLRIADRLVQMQASSRTGFGWEYDVPNFKYYAVPPWCSGMGQGLGISVLLRAHQLEPERDYIAGAARAIHSFETGAAQGGCREVDAQGNVWYEEVPSTAPAGSAHILNGFIFALWGLYDYVRVTQEARVRALLEPGLATLRATAPQFDTGYWTRYSLKPEQYLATRFYHQLHIDGFRIFHQLTGDPSLADWERRWTRYTTDTVCLARWRLTLGIFRVFHRAKRAYTYWQLM